MGNMQVSTAFEYRWHFKRPLKWWIFFSSGKPSDLKNDPEWRESEGFKWQRRKSSGKTGVHHRNSILEGAGRKPGRAHSLQSSVARGNSVGTKIWIEFHFSLKSQSDCFSTFCPCEPILSPFQLENGEANKSLVIHCDVSLSLTLGHDYYDKWLGLRVSGISSRSMS